jgi:predicted ATPase
MGDNATGTVTFLFTDIEGSTERWQRDDRSMSASLEAHDHTIRSVVERHGGIVFKHTGDGMCAVFGSASAAVAAAVEAQAGLELPVRMGLHTGEAESRDDDYFGPTLNLAARVMDAGHGGQVLVSSATAGLVRDCALVDLGQHRLKGLQVLERIFQVGGREFPALRVATAHKGNLPVDATRFVGRVGELNDVVGRVTEHRSVTLLGVGGTGKTRLAAEVGHRLAPAFPDGCWMAELSRVVVPEAVPHAVCAGVGLEIPERADVAEFVVSRLRHQRLLLVIDNCEHVLEAAADIVEAILASCPTVTVVATSREPLMVAGEHLVPTASLTPEDAVELFVERVGAEAPSMVLDERQMASVRAICERLDRLPLAIELAASRARSMSPIEIESRLDERFRLLVGGRRSRMERHQTMRGTVDWSYELCSDLEQEVFCRLSVFAGEFDLGGSLGVGGDGAADRWDVEDALARLVDRSLVQRIPAPDGTTRYRLLETMRAYGHERLVENGTADAARLGHVTYLWDVIGELGLRALGPDEDEVRSRIRRHTADLLQAVDWCLERQEWRFLPRFCSYTVSWSAPRVAFSLWQRVRSAIPPINASMDRST